MNQPELIHLLPYFASLGLSAGIFVYAWKRRHIKGVGAYLWILASESLWMLGYFGEVSSPTLEGKIFWDGLGWLAVCAAIVAFPVFAAHFTGYEPRRASGLFLLSLIVPAAFLFLVATDGLFHGIRIAPSFEAVLPLAELRYGYAPAAIIFLIYSYLAAAIGIGILLRRLIQPHAFFRAQVLTVILGILIPVLGIALSLPGTPFWSRQNPTPFSMAVGNLVITWGLFRLGIFQIAPVGRDQVFESMVDPVVILDNRHFIVDIDRSMLDLLGKKSSEVIGRSGKEIFADFPIPIKLYTDVSYARVEAAFPIGKKTVTYELSIWPLYDQARGIKGRVYVLHDITALKELENDLRNLNQLLEQRVEARTRELAEAYDTTLEGWARTLELRDKETEGHSRRVTETTLKVARALDIPEEEIVHIRRGAILHDIGKMSIPDKILLKRGPLTEKEMEVVHQHPATACRLLECIPFLEKALEIPYCHHEKWNGSGYPRGLRGRAIPLSARIFAVVDVWDAVQSHRPYNRAWPREQAIQYLRDQAGLHFDPRIVDVFLREVEQGRI